MIAVADLRKRALSAAYSGGPSGIFSWREMLFPSRNFHFGRPKTNFSGFKKWKGKKKCLLPLLPVMPLGPFDLVAYATFLFPFLSPPFFFFGGTDFLVEAIRKIIIFWGVPVSSCWHCWLLNPQVCTNKEIRKSKQKNNAIDLIVMKCKIQPNIIIITL